MANENTLKLVTVVFRHGNRTPDGQMVIPVNPYPKQTFFPYKLGELTIDGQKHMIRIGQALRVRYRQFLGNQFYTDLVVSTSSSYTRCQMSLQCVHAGLFAPEELDPEFPTLQWQAVPYTAIPFSEDKFLSVHMSCPDLMCNIDPDEIPDDDLGLLEYIRDNSGYTKAEYVIALRCYDFFKTCAEAGLTLPEWITAIWDQLERLAYTFWQHFHTKRRRYGAGPLLKRILNEARLKITKQVPEGRKMYLYAGHDMNLHLLRGAMEVWDTEPVQYGAYLIFELHNINDEYGFKIFYNNGDPEPRLMRIPGYGEFINVDDFATVTQYLHDPEVNCATLDDDNK